MPPGGPRYLNVGYDVRPGAAGETEERTAAGLSKRGWTRECLVDCIQHRLAPLGRGCPSEHVSADTNILRGVAHRLCCLAPDSPLACCTTKLVHGHHNRFLRECTSLCEHGKDEVRKLVHACGTHTLARAQEYERAVKCVAALAHTRRPGGCKTGA
jgi:hypothetical protein